jgi:hypothetical protein
VGNRKRSSSRTDTEPTDSGYAVDSHVEEMLGAIFARLRTTKKPKTRPKEFELLLQKLFRLSGFDAERDPPIARPRQTDLLARRAEQLYLLEAKWQRDPIDINDLDSFHARLLRAPRGTIGCFFSMSAYTRPAIDGATRLRSTELGGHEVLLFDPSEVAALFGGRRRLNEAISTKLRLLREAGITQFLQAPVDTRLRSLDIPFPTPTASRPCDLDTPYAGRAYNFAVYGGNGRRWRARSWNPRARW